jgi:hypothetical protein
VPKVVLAVIVAFVLAGAFVGRASADPRCCRHQKPPQTGSSGPGGLPYTGVPLYIPVLLSLGAIGTGVVLRRRMREQL